MMVHIRRHGKEKRERERERERKKERERERRVIKRLQRGCSALHTRSSECSVLVVYEAPTPHEDEYTDKDFT